MADAMPSSARSAKASLILLLASVIWGFAFVAQRLGMDHIGPFLFSGLRNLLGAVTVWAVVALRERRLAPLVVDGTSWRSPTLRGGVICGVVLFVAANFQQVGLVYVQAAKAGFLTTLYIVLVPLAGLWLRHRVRGHVWGAVVLAVVGLYLLCLTDLRMAPGDLLVLIGALCWAAQILAVDRYVRRADVFRLCVIQFLVCGLLSLVFYPWADPWFVTVPAGQLGGALWAALPALLFAGVLSSGVAFTCQALGQRVAPPTLASLIMSLEAPFATLAGYVVLGEELTRREGLGCVLMFVAIVVAQLPGRGSSGSRVEASEVRQRRIPPGARSRNSEKRHPPSQRHGRDPN